MNNLLEQVPKEKLVELLIAEREKKSALESILAEVQTKGKRASEGQLDDLQGHVAEVMNEQIMYQDTMMDFDEEGQQIEGEKRYSASPALLGVVTKFLKDNNIVTNISTNENLNTLQKTLGKKKRHSETLPSPKKVVNLMD